MTVVASPPSVSVLLIEGNLDCEELVRGALRGSRVGDFCMSKATCLAEAVSMLGRQDFDAILLELAPPGSSGVAILTRIADEAPDVPVVVLTGADDDTLGAALLRRGAQGHLRKDEIDSRTLGRSIHHAIERSCILRERRLADEALRRSEADFCALVEILPEAVAVHQGGLLVYLNPACQRMLGSEGRRQLLGKPIADCVHPDDRVALAELVTAVERGQKSKSERDLRLCRLDGGLVETKMLVMPVSYRGGPAVLGVARDMTERNRAQAQAIGADGAVAVGIVAAGLAHEINNPLSYVIGNLDFLRHEISRFGAEQGAATRRAALEEAAESSNAAGVAGGGFGELLASIEDAREGADRIRLLVSDLKLLARDDGQQDRQVRVEPLLESVIKMLWDEICARAQLVRNYEPVSAVRADPTRLTQVFLNLLTNALRALSLCSPGEGEIQVSLRRRGDGGVLVEIGDNGLGIAPELQGRVFEPCHAAASSDQRSPGLELSVCRTLITEMGGEISLETRVGVGSVFRVALPPAQREQPPRRARTTSARPSTDARSGGRC